VKVVSQILKYGLRRPAARVSLFLIFSFSFFFHSFFLAGDIGQLNLPVGMQSVDFEYCEGITGTAESLGD
jgi:hypothetical protein